MKKAFIAKLTLAALVAITGNAFAQEVETEVIDQVAEVVETADAQESVSDVPVSTETEVVPMTEVVPTTEVMPMTEGEMISPVVPMGSEVVYDAAPMMSSPCVGCGQVATPMVSDCGSCGQATYSAPVAYAAPVSYAAPVNYAAPVAYAAPTVSNDCGCSNSCNGCVGQVAYQEPIVQQAPTPASIVQGGINVTQAPITTSNAIISSPVNAIQASTPITYGTPTTYATPITTTPTPGCSSCGSSAVSQPIYGGSSTIVDGGYTTGASYYPAATTYTSSCNNCQPTGFGSRPLLRRAGRSVGIGLLRNRN